ncbi:MAG: hypothetical protein KY445_15535, partial [Armatimonadetes bacterium]|nr:hypothetical protein [Armatimonadota bacterium]
KSNHASQFNPSPYSEPLPENEAGFSSIMSPNNFSEKALPGGASLNRTPLYEAIHAERYRRQQFIRDIEEKTGRRLLIYFSNTNHPQSFITGDDVEPFQDLLLDCDKGDKIDLLLQTNGGEIDPAEKLVFMLRSRASEFRLIVTERAKSAGTLMAMAADEIVMSTTSELGPIDPQISMPQADGRYMQYPAQSFLDGLDAIRKRVVDEGGLNPADYPLLSQLNPALLDQCKKELVHSQQFAEKWLKRYMLKDQPDKAAEIAGKLGDVRQYSSHGMVIDHQEAKDMGLNVAFYEPDDALWQEFWRLHLDYKLAVQQSRAAKAFESRRVAVVI